MIIPSVGDQAWPMCFSGHAAGQGHVEGGVTHAVGAEAVIGGEGKCGGVEVLICYV